MALAPVQKEAERFCRQLGLSDSLSMLERAWQAEMGGWANMARIAALDNLSLVVEVKSSPAMHELTLRRRELVRRLNRHMGTTFLRNIIVRMQDGH